MLRKNKAVLWRELGGEAVLLDPAAGCSYNLNVVGTLIWKMLDGKNSIEDIVETICASYEVVAEVAHQDVERTLMELRQHNLLDDHDMSLNP